jgi:hypothetical protein
MPTSRSAGVHTEPSEPKEAREPDTRCAVGSGAVAGPHGTLFGAEGLVTDRFGDTSTAPVTREIKDAAQQLRPWTGTSRTTPTGPVLLPAVARQLSKRNHPYAVIGTASVWELPPSSCLAIGDQLTVLKTARCGNGPSVTPARLSAGCNDDARRQPGRFLTSAPHRAI